MVGITSFEVRNGLGVIITDRTGTGGNAIASVRLSVRLFPLYLQNRLTVDLELFACE